MIWVCSLPKLLTNKNKPEPVVSVHIPCVYLLEAALEANEMSWHIWGLRREVGLERERRNVISLQQKDLEINPPVIPSLASQGLARARG